MARILSKARIVGIVEQANWSGVENAASAFEKLYVDTNSIKINPDVNLSGFDHTSGVGLMLERDRQVSEYLGGLARVSFSMVATKQNLALFFAGALHKATEVAKTPYQKVIVPLYETEVPDFYNATNKQPHLFTLALTQYDYGDGLLTCAVVDKLKFRVEYNNRGVAKLAKIDVEMVGKWVEESDWDSATFASTTKAYYNDATHFSFGTSTTTQIASANLRTFEVSINNNVSVDNRTNGGELTDYVLNNPEITASFTFPDYNGSAAYNSLLKAGTELSVLGKQGSSGVDGFLQIELKGRMTNNDYLGNENAYDSATIQLRCEKPSSGSCCQITIADAVERNWIAP